MNSPTQTLITPGLYEHYKGARYRVIGVARHSETEEALVVYQALYGDGGHWARPLTMFEESVQTAAGSQPRFRLVEPSIVPVWEAEPAMDG